MAHLLGGKVQKGDNQTREYGKTVIEYGQSPIFEGISSNQSHTDYILEVPEGFDVVATTKNCPVAAMHNVDKKLYGVQFHPEVEHSIEGDKIITNFLYKICQVSGLDN